MGAPFKLLSQAEYEKLSMAEQLAYTREHMVELRRNLENTKRHLAEARETLARIKGLPRKF